MTNDPLSPQPEPSKPPRPNVENVEKELSESSVASQTDSLFSPSKDRIPAANREAPRPRIWPLFVLLFVTIGVIIGAQAMGVVALMLVTGLFQLQPDQMQSRLVETLNRPGAFIYLGLLSQIPMLAGALIAARLSPEPMRERLKLCSPHWSAGKYVLVALATFVPAGVGLGGAYLVQAVLPADESVATMYANMTWSWVVPFLLFISLFPGFGEELMFRGYVQGRLLKRFHPFWAIGLASFLFAIFHITPHAVVFAFPVGLWLGWIAWRTASVWPGILCHAFLNFSWNVVHTGNVLLNWNDSAVQGICWTGLAIGLIAMVWLLKLGVATTPPSTVTDSAVSNEE